ncbi:MAG: SDR family oxidoreductase [Chitinophagaceae bacterium]|nr:SDR family oxidoreductase [Chitinophagaceae bacterium]
MKVFISGASGLIGSNCLKYFKVMGWNAVGSYFSYPTSDTVYFDTLNPDHADNFNLSDFQPDVIVHCGALTHVDYCEDHIEESEQKTVHSTKNLIELARRFNSKLVYISTDYVFDGQHGPYHENDTTNPLSVYAKHKLEAEEMVLRELTNCLVLRVTNVYGNEEREKNFVSRIIRQCLNGEKLKLKLPLDQYATPVNAWDVARAMYLLLRDQHLGIFHMASTDWMNRVELALTVLKYFPNAEYELIAETTEQLQQAAKRPLMGGLQKTRFAQLYPEFLFSNVDDFVRIKLPKGSD